MKTTLTTLVVSLSLIGLVACKKESSSAPGKPASEAPRTVSNTSSESATTLKVKWPLHNRYVYRMDMDQHSTNRIPQMPSPLQQDVVMSMTYSLSVTKETPEGGHEVEIEVLASEMEVKMGGQVLVAFDSKEDAKGAAKNPIAEPLRRMIGAKVRAELNPDGGVEKMLGMDEWNERISGGGGGGQSEMLTQQFNEGMFRQLVDSRRGLPTKPVKVGDSWPFKTQFPTGPTGDIGIDATVHLTGWEDREQHHCAVLETKGTMKGAPGAPGPMGKMTIEQGKLSGRSWFDGELGAMIDVASDQTMKVTGQIPGPGGKPAGNFTSEIGQKITVKLVELGKIKG